MTKEFTKSLRTVAKPVLEKHGYAFDGKRKFIKQIRNEKELVVEYQIGTRFTQGKFTVNLIVGDELERLGTIKPTVLSKVVNKVFGQNDPWWKAILLPKDKWWKISPFQKEMDSIIRKTIKELEVYGISWLEGRDSAT